MGFSALRTAVTSKVGIQTLIVRKHSPAILFGAGMVGIGATIYLASRGTLKMDEILREAEEKRTKITAALQLDNPEYTEEDAKKDGLTARVQLAVKILRAYAPAIAVGTFTVGALTGSHMLLNKRYAGVTAAYAAVDKGFKEYRSRVIADQGEAKDNEYRFGQIEKQIGVDTDEGIVEKTVKGADPEYAKRSGGRSMYARIFERDTSKDWSPYPGRNSTFVRVQQQWANDMLNANGFLLLNDAYKLLGLKPTSAGAQVGWVKHNDRGGDDYISFGVVESGFNGERFVNGDEDSVWLDFNVDGVVYDLIDKTVEENI
jgi:hypothetical protein